MSGREEGRCSSSNPGPEAVLVPTPREGEGEVKPLAETLIAKAVQVTNAV